MAAPNPTPEQRVIALAKASAARTQYATKGAEMKISARNVIKGTVKSVEEGAVNGHVRICRGNHNGIVASITNEPVEQLGIELGCKAYAIIKSSDVMVAVD